MSRIGMSKAVLLVGMTAAIICSAFAFSWPEELCISSHHTCVKSRSNKATPTYCRECSKTCSRPAGCTKRWCKKNQKQCQETPRRLGKLQKWNTTEIRCSSAHAATFSGALANKLKLIMRSHCKVVCAHSRCKAKWCKSNLNECRKRAN